MQDRFEAWTTSLDAPASHAFAVTPSNADLLTEATRALYVGGGGNLALVMLSGAEISLLSVAAGSILPLRVRQVKATGTTATALVGLV